MKCVICLSELTQLKFSNVYGHNSTEDTKDRLTYHRGNGTLVLLCPFANYWFKQITPTFAYPIYYETNTYIIDNILLRVLVKIPKVLFYGDTFILRSMSDKNDVNKFKWDL